MNHFPEFAAKMRTGALSEAAIRAFENSYQKLLAGDSGLMPEESITPVEDPPRLAGLAAGSNTDRSQMIQTVVLKLNGGLGTSMGLDQAKSLLRVKEDKTFLDLIARQILHLREELGAPLQFLIMNSLTTSEGTLEYLARRYPELGGAREIELLQSVVPKVDAATLRPVSWPENPQLEWCPPGHGDIYASLLGSGWLTRLLERGMKYLFVSNADNLGASLDPQLLNYFAESGCPFMMEVAERTAADRKGGHLARRNGQFLLRESAQCPETDQPAFQDITRHRFFNTNNLWIRLDALHELLRASGGFIQMPLIKNKKTVDPRNRNSPPVFQLETAMGAAIEAFAGSGAIVVPRSRFAPVKTTADLLALRSDAYEITKDWRIELAPSRNGEPPVIDLDPEHYRLVDQLDAALAGGVPSLIQCRELSVRGPVLFQEGNRFRGGVTLCNLTGQPEPLPGGEYEGTISIPSAS